METGVMATVAIINPAGDVVREARLYPRGIAPAIFLNITGAIKEIEYQYFGSLWSFVEMYDGRAYWVHESGKIVESMRMHK